MGTNPNRRFTMYMRRCPRGATKVCRDRDYIYRTKIKLSVTCPDCALKREYSQNNKNI